MAAHEPWVGRWVDALPRPHRRQPTLADPCPTSEVTQIYFDGCLPSIDPPQGQLNLRGPDELPEIRGIPCDGSNTGTCIGLSQLPAGASAQPNAGPAQPDTQVRSSP